MCRCILDSHGTEPFAADRLARASSEIRNGRNRNLESRKTCVRWRCKRIRSTRAAKALKAIKQARRTPCHWAAVLRAAYTLCAITLDTCLRPRRDVLHHQHRHGAPLEVFYRPAPMPILFSGSNSDVRSGRVFNRLQRSRSGHSRRNIPRREIGYPRIPIRPPRAFVRLRFVEPGLRFLRQVFIPPVPVLAPRRTHYPSDMARRGQNKLD